MFYRIFVTALVAGVGAGLLAAVLQLIYTTPLILQAEVFESGIADAASAIGNAASLAHDWGRHGLTVLASVLTAIGMGLMLTAAMALRGRPVDARTGALWGIAGFAALVLAPTLGLSPELPGAGAAPLADRQLWWLATVVASTVGLGVLVFVPNRALKIAAMALILAPHIIGAPQPDAFMSTAPAELAGHFAGVSLVLNAVLWITLGLLAGAVYRWLAEREIRLAPSSG